MMQPKRRKYRKAFRGKMRGTAGRGYELNFGEFGLKAMGRGWLSSAQIEAGRRSITNTLKRKGRVWIRVFPDKPVTSRGAGQRMGGGKGPIDRYVSVVTPGRMIYEVTGQDPEVVLDALRRASNKMPFKTKIVKKEE